MSNLAIVIVSWNVRELLHACLASLGAAHDIIVVDSASHDGSADMVHKAFPHVALHALHENIGYVKGNNLALREVLARPDAPEFVWLLNPDTVVQPGCSEALLAFMRATPRCGLCGPQLLNPDGSLQHGAFAFPGMAQLLIDTQPRLARFRDTQLDGRYPPAYYQQGQPFRIGFALGAGMLARRTAIEQVGLLDDMFEMYCEEVDWAQRMADAGWERWCVPAARLIHHGGASSDQASDRSKRVLWQSRLRYYDRHYFGLKRLIAKRIANNAIAALAPAERRSA
jgi:hypothetical protein